MISFSQKVKTELISRPVPAYCCSTAELASYILALGSITESGCVNILSENEALISRIAELSKKVLKANASVLKIGNVYSVMLAGGKKFHEKYDEVLKVYEYASGKRISEIYKKDCCRASFIKGIFISLGSVVNPEKNYGLELVFRDQGLAEAVACVFKELEMELKYSKRKNSHILYTKNSDVICDFLTRIGAYNEYMQLLNLKIEREMRNSFNRAVNSEIANMDKTIKASIKHITAIERIKKEMGLEALPDELYELARLRLENKNMSMGELAKKLNPPITKSGVNHRLNKLMKIADSL